MHVPFVDILYRERFGPLTVEHVPVGPVGHGEDVRRHLRPPLPLIHPDHPLRVDGEVLVRVHGHAEQAGVSLRQILKSGR